MKWTKQILTELALQCKTKKEFVTNYPNAYNAAFKKGILQEICSHMTALINPPNHWTIERCVSYAIKYQHKKDFFYAEPTVYNIAYRKGFIDEICKHMIPLGHIFKRCIYAYEFEDNHVYVGLTSDIGRRNKEHLTTESGSIYKHIKYTGLSPKLKQLSDYLDNEIISKLEDETIEKYKMNGWYVLNKRKGGSLGSVGRLYTKDNCAEIALKYTTKRDFKKNHINIYNRAVKSKWINEICSHMVQLKHPPNHWSFENCKIEASKYNSRSEFEKGSKSAYSRSVKNKWLDNFFPASKR